MWCFILFFFSKKRQIDTSECPAACTVLAPDTPPPSPPEIPQQRLARDQLQPPTPSVFLENKKHAFSPQLQEFCLKHPIAVVRQMASALKLGEFHISTGISISSTSILSKFVEFELIVLLNNELLAEKFLQECSLNDLIVMVSSELSLL
jgi:hypothetical protein